MHYAAPLALIALSLLTGCTTTPPASEPQISLMRPSECLAPCPQLPTPTDADELAVAERPRRSAREQVRVARLEVDVESLLVAEPREPRRRHPARFDVEERLLHRRDHG